MISYLLSLLPFRFALLSAFNSLSSLCLFVISALFLLPSLPLTSQMALGMYLLLHEREESSPSRLSRYLQALLLKWRCCLPPRELMFSLCGGKALHQQVSYKFSHTPGRSPQNLAAERPSGALS